MFTKLSASIEQVMGSIDYNNILKLRGLNQRTLLYGQPICGARRRKLSTPSSFFALASHSGWKDRNVDCCVNAAVDTSTCDKNFVNFGLITPQS